jgi:hypothetical protein
MGRSNSTSLCPISRRSRIDLSLAWIELGESLQGVMQCDQIRIRLRRNHQRLVERDSARVATMFEVLMAAREIDQDVTHHLRGNGEEVRPTLPLRSGLMTALFLNFARSSMS